MDVVDDGGKNNCVPCCCCCYPIDIGVGVEQDGGEDAFLRERLVNE